MCFILIHILLSQLSWKKVVDNSPVEYRESRASIVSPVELLQSCAKNKKSHKDDFGAFFTTRMLKILPALYVMIASWEGRISQEL